jgi:single-strand DNA-binding protein
MVSLNRVIVAGNLTRDPELKVTPSNRKFTSMAIAINEFWKDKTGKTTKKTSFINIIAWGGLAENCAKYLKKGRAVMVEGRIECDKYEDRQGKTQYITRINCNNIVFLENNGRNSESIEEDDCSDEDDNFCESSQITSKKSSLSKKSVKKQVKELA